MNKRPYQKPELTNAGNLKIVTRQTVKQFGGYDGLFLLQDDGSTVPIGNVSSS